jgi:hypothetical protein
MTSECKAEVKRDEIRAAEDYRLNYRLNKACDAEIDDLCADVCSPFQGQACGGTVIKCLTEKGDNITNTDCRTELFGIEKREGKDWRNDAVRAGLAGGVHLRTNRVWARGDGRRKMRLERGTTPTHPRRTCVAGDRRALRNSGVSSSPTRIPGPFTSRVYVRQLVSR